jgi:hypothetical protein
MRNLSYLILSVLIVACSGSDSSDETNLDYLGTYKGDIEAYINGAYHSTVFNHSMSFVAIGSSNEVMIDGSLVITNTCTIVDESLTIPETIAVSTKQFYALEYGNGTFDGNQLQIEMHQDQISQSTNEILNSAIWTGILVKVD